MTEARIVKLELTMEHLADSVTRIADNTSEITKQVSDILTVVAIQQEKDTASDIRQQEINKNVTAFIDEYKTNDKPIVDKAGAWQKWFTWWSTRVIAPVVLGAILLAAGAQMYDKAVSKQQSTKSN